MTAEEALFRAHLEGVPFRSGLDRERWGFPGEPSVAWPHCILWVQCEPRFGASDRLSLRFDVTGYSATAPNAVPWDTEKNQVLPGDKWPKGPGNVSKVFNPRLEWRRALRAVRPNRDGGPRCVEDRASTMVVDAR